MTSNERFKKQVRARMARTGEKYGAARRALLERTRASAAAVEVDGRVWASEPEVPDASVLEHTARSWNDWCDLIETLPEADDGHAAVAKALADGDYGLNAWWSQAVTIGWERITGRRVPGQMGDGSFAANKSMTMPGDADALRALVFDDDARPDLFTGVTVTLRSKPTTKVLRLGIAVGPATSGTAMLSIEDKGDGRMRVGVQHTGLVDLTARENWLAYWTAWLDDLASAVDPE